MHRIGLFFIYTLCLALILPALLPNLPILFFAPFLILTFYNKDKITCLWIALICGLIIDLLSAQTRLGVYALNYCLVVWILYPQKYHFFEDSVSTLPIMTFLFSILSTLIQVALIYLFSQGVVLSWDWVKSELLWIPMLDAFYAGLAFTLPYLFLPKTSKRRTTIISPKKSY